MRSALLPLMSIGDIRWRQRVKIRGTVRSMRIQPWAGVPTLEVHVYDDTGGVGIVFLGRRSVAGVRLGHSLTAAGMVGLHHGRLAILNPDFEVQAVA